ncbi:YecR family lipoprotein [Pseudomonas sp. BN515]|uniref:YecR family lipoprotein n=1 Tax=Pseudomonas sp. BN515 TaxID=2567892 RepID=UPI002458AD07|nr:YecR family lipoprotein [Pseudomonas sp. BN515]
MDMMATSHHDKEVAVRATPLALLSLAAVLTISGCTTKKDFYAMGGSRADGTVDLAYDFAPFEQPVVNVSQAQSIAKSKCQVWGYQEAEAFGGQQQNCHQFNGYGSCVAGQIVVKYQCIGTADRPVASSSFAPATPQATATPSGALSRDQWKQKQLEKLDQETGLSYEEYQRRYKAITGQ